MFGTSPPPTYNGNGSDDGTAPADGNSYEEGDTLTVLANTGGLTKAGVLFKGWNTAPDASGAIRTAGTSFPMGGANELL